MRTETCRHVAKHSKEGYRSVPSHASCFAIGFRCVVHDGSGGSIAASAARFQKLRMDLSNVDLGPAEEAARRRGGAVIGVQGLAFV